MIGCKLCDEYERNLTLASGSNSDMVEEPDPALKTQSVIKSFLPETELNGVLSSTKNAFGYFVKPVSPTFCNAHTSKFATERRQNLDRIQPSFEIFLLSVQDAGNSYFEPGAQVTEVIRRPRVRARKMIGQINFISHE